jgi:hypothetical protein
MNNVNYENPADLIRRQMQAQAEVILPQAILTQGVLVDVFKSRTSSATDKVYGGYTGQKMETVPTMRTRILGLEFGQFRASKSSAISGWFQGGTCYVLADSGIVANDVVQEVGTEIKFLIQHAEVVGTAGPRQVMRLKVSSLFE